MLGPFATATSDLDLVAVTDRAIEAPYRATVVEESWPVEMFVHTPESWITYRDREIRSRHIAITAICASGVILIDRDGEARRMQAEARLLLEKGPLVTVEEWERLRYGLTDQILDLQGSQSPSETLFIANDVANTVCRVIAAHHRRWPGRGKRSIRVLADIDQVRSAALTDALRRVFATDDTGPLVDLALQALAMVGGPLYEGFRQTGSMSEIDQ